MTTTEKSKVWLLLEAVGLTGLAFIVSLMLGVALIVPLIIMGFSLDSTLVLSGSTILGQIGFLLVAILFIRYKKIELPFDIPSRSNLKYIGGGIVLTIVTAIGLLQLQSILDLMSKSAIQDMAESNPVILLILAVLSVVLVAPSEELLFRGAIQGRLRERFGPYFSIITASLLFGSLHLLNFTGSVLPTLMSAFIIVVIGSILGWLYEQTKNIAVPITVHAIYNFILLVPSYFAIV